MTPSLSKFAAASVLATVLVTGCASKDKKADASTNAATAGSTTASAKTTSTKAATATVEDKQVAYEQQAAYVTELNFKKGSKTLTAADQALINKMVSDAKAAGTLKEITVISWADTEYPSPSTKQLSRKERLLAGNRGREIESFLKKNEKSLKVNLHNMAQRPNELQELFNTKDAQVKKSLEVAGIPNTDTSVKTPSKASKAIVMAILKR